MPWARWSKGGITPTECLFYVVLQVAAPILFYGAIWIVHLAVVSSVVGGGYAYRQSANLAGAWRLVVALDLVHAALAIAAHAVVAGGERD